MNNITSRTTFKLQNGHIQSPESRFIDSADDVRKNSRQAGLFQQAREFNSEFKSAVDKFVQLDNKVVQNDTWEPRRTWWGGEKMVKVPGVPSRADRAPARGHVVVTAPVEKRTVDKLVFDPAELDLHGSAAKLATGLSELSQGVDQNNGPTYWNYSVRPHGSKVISKRTKSPVSETVTHKHYYIGDRRIGYHVQDTQMVIDEARGEVAFLVGERHFQPVR